ncbi:MAG TPA: M1 family aminopeptidase [Longimicrobium sp.]|nr:M1 family aminopeptidase [Longimicrobium sp.]
MTRTFRVAALAALVPLAACASGGTAPPGAPRPETLMQTGISRELARQRAATLSGVRYDLWLDLTQRDSAAGIVAMTFERARNAGDLVADFRGPALAELRANGDPVRDFEWRNGHVRIPAHHLRAGQNRLEARFTTRIAPAGTAIIRFDDRSDQSTYLYTLLVPSDANLLFPCFDQPDLKARFRWRLSAPAGWKVLANARVESADTARPGDNSTGAVTWNFAETEPISTYLAAFAAGPYATWSSAPAGERPITLYARASRRAEVDADTLTRTNRDAARWLEGWFGVPFPFSKLDMVLAPAFPFGGMEHVGEIFYNENSFIFREPPTLTQRLGRDATIFHEVAHQWFGDLVTMRWFDDLWLKEGFATYMAARMQNELRPGSEAWKTFYLRNKPLAYGVDVTRGTTPVWQELGNLDLAKSNYGPIVYNKAPSVIKQLSFLVGDTAFRAGLHGFLTSHAYANATWQDLLASIQQASGTSLQRFGEQYILRAGMPRVDTRLEMDGAMVRSLVLTQRIARPLEGDPGGWWPMKVNVRLGYHDRPDVILPAQFNGDSVLVQGAAGLPVPDYVWPNDGDYGYGLFFPDERSAAWIADHVGEVKDGLLRAMLWGALWDLVRDTRLPPARFAEIALRELPREADEQIASLILDRGATALTRYASSADAARLYPAWERVLAERARDARLGYGMRKESLDMLVATARTPEARAILREYLAGTRKFDGAAVRQPTRWSIVQQLLSLGEPQARALYDAEVRRDSTPEAARRAFVAAVAAPDTAVKAAYFRRYLDDPTLNEEWVTASLGAFNDPDQARLTLPFLRPSLERLEWIRDNRRIFFLPSWINAFIRAQSSPEALATVDRLLEEHPELPIDIRRKVLQARDELERTVAIRRAAGAE